MDVLGMLTPSERAADGCCGIGPAAAIAAAMAMAALLDRLCGDASQLGESSLGPE